MPPGKTGKSDKGKQRAVVDGNSLELPLDPLEFVQAQVAALSKPLKLLDRSQYFFEDQDGNEIEPPQQKALDKAVKALSRQLDESRRRKYTDASVQGIVEQIEYLKEQRASEKNGPELDEDGKLRVDANDWLNELPDEWPAAHENAGELDDEALQEYRELHESVRRLKSQRHTLQQKDEHYAQLCKLLNSDIDVGKLQRILRGGEPKSKRAKKGNA